VEHLERPVTEVDDVALVDTSYRADGLLAERGQLHAGWDGVDEVLVGHRVAHRLEPVDHLVAPGVADVQRAQRRVEQQRRLRRVRHDVVELVVAADVVVVTVGGHGGDRLVDQVGQLVAERHHAHAGVDHQVAVASAYVPDVAAHQRDDVRLPQQRDGVVDGGTFEPDHCFLARLGCTRVGSPSIFGYCGGQGASTRPASWSRCTSASSGSSGCG
jgi:hypothetical protein